MLHSGYTALKFYSRFPLWYDFRMTDIRNFRRHKEMRESRAQAMADLVAAAQYLNGLAGKVQVGEHDQTALEVLQQLAGHLKSYELFLEEELRNISLDD